VYWTVTMLYSFVVFYNTALNLPSPASDHNITRHGITNSSCEENSTQENYTLTSLNPDTDPLTCAPYSTLIHPCMRGIERQYDNFAYRDYLKEVFDRIYESFLESISEGLWKALGKIPDAILRSLTGESIEESHATGTRCDLRPVENSLLHAPIKGPLSTHELNYRALLLRQRYEDKLRFARRQRIDDLWAYEQARIYPHKYQVLPRRASYARPSGRDIGARGLGAAVLAVVRFLGQQLLRLLRGIRHLLFGKTSPSP